MDAHPLSAADLPALRDLAQTAKAEGFGFLERFVHDLDAGRAMVGGATDFFVAFVDRGELVAVGGVTADPYLTDPTVGRLRHVYVIPERRGEGIGRRLVSLLEMRARRAGYGHLRLRTDTLAAARFYERLGYDSTAEDSATHRRALTTELPGA